MAERVNLVSSLVNAYKVWVRLGNSNRYFLTCFCTGGFNQAISMIKYTNPNYHVLSIVKICVSCGAVVSSRDFNVCTKCLAKANYNQKG